MAKQVMEVNGVANLMILLEGLESCAPSLTNEQYEHVAKAHEQLELLERYMLAFNKAVQEGTANPFWHEVKANPSAYPTNREKSRR